MDEDKPVFLEPTWIDDPSAETCAYAAADGGVVNNKPFDIARKSLSGVRGRNDQLGTLADRAVIVIDPLVKDPQPGPSRDADLFEVVARLLPALIYQAWLSSQDLAQVLSNNVYSRFIISPTRDGKKKYYADEALATGELVAFFGLFSRKHREHDYLLGRRNAQKFLKTVFTLPLGNDLFDCGRWSELNKKAFSDKTDPKLVAPGDESAPELQIIPVCGTAAVEELLPDWPKGTFDDARRNEVKPLIKKRVRALGWKLHGIAKQNLLARAKGLARVTAYFKSGGLWIVWLFARRPLIGKLYQALDDAAKRTDERD